MSTTIMHEQTDLQSTIRQADRGRGIAVARFGAVAALAGTVLVLTAANQIFDTNFYTLWEATALLAGDHPYRDFFEWGVFLQAVVSAVAQYLSGHRLIGEFIVHWLFIVCGTVIAFHLGVRASRSVAATCATMLIAILLLAATPTFHYPKLFLYPLAVWLSWRYMDAPSATRAAALGVATAVAFLFRHDHGVYIGAGAALAFAVRSAISPRAGRRRAALRESAAYAAAATVIIAPWLVLVQSGEGVRDYVRLRADLYAEWSARDSPYRSLLRINPLRALMPITLPPPKPAVVSFKWNAEIGDEQQRRLEERFGLRLIEAPDATRRARYEVGNVFDPGLLELSSHINDSTGFEWDLLRASRSRLPTAASALTWLHQITLAVPILVLVAAGTYLVQGWWYGRPIPRDVYLMIVAAAFLAIVNGRMFREPSYFVGVAPVTAALAARLLAGRRRAAGAAAASGRPSHVSLRQGLYRAIAIALLLVTAVTVVAYTRDTGIFEPDIEQRIEWLGETFDTLLASPPIEAAFTREAALAVDEETWRTGAVDRTSLLFRYIRDCTRPDDRVLVTGSTPYQVGYYTERPIAGGHLFWHHGWRSDPIREMQSLALLTRQSVPFALSTGDPVLDDFRSYPRIREHLARHYVELDGTEGRVLVDTRRQPTGYFGLLRFPCFR